jgi:dephospho-CoA kinase
MRIIKGAAGQAVIGITGGMGSGKSAVATLLQKRLHSTFIDADVICRELLAPGAAGWLSFRESFGPAYFNPDQSINRSLLRRLIFSEEEARLRLNRLLHPLAREEIGRQMENAPESRCFLVEIPLLYEAGWQAELDRIVVVYACQDRCRKRLMKRDLISEQEAEKAMASQWPLTNKALLADHVIDNSGPWAFTCLQVLRLQVLLKGIFQAAEGISEKND